VQVIAKIHHSSENWFGCVVETGQTRKRKHWVLSLSGTGSASPFVAHLLASDSICQCYLVTIPTQRALKCKPKQTKSTNLEENILWTRVCTLQITRLNVWTLWIYMKIFMDHFGCIYELFDFTIWCTNLLFENTMHQKLKEWKTRFRSVMLQLLMSLKSSSYQTSSAPVQPVIAESCWGPLWSETHPCFTSHKPSACSGCSKQGTN